MSPVINYMTSADIERRRSELLDVAGISIDELRTKNLSYLLDPSEQALLRELEDLEYLAEVD